MQELLKEFALDGDILYCGRFGSGHINETYLVLDSTGRQYIAQRVNTGVFKDPAGLMDNITRVIGHLAQKGVGYRGALHLVPTRAGGQYLLRGDVCCRVYDYVADCLALNAAETPEDFAQSAQAFGNFQRLLADFPAASLHETIPNFHNTPVRYAALHSAVAQNPLGRAAQAAAEIEFALAQEEYAGLLVAMQQAGTLPLRVTHNDTKLNNVLFDRHTRKALCVIDLDTVMPGLAAYDFGDSIRFGASTAAEDEPDIARVALSLPLYEAYTRGFLQVCGADLTPKEMETLPDGAIMMTLECGVRFLTDYLLGDVYFKTAHPGHNLQRARAQLALVRDMQAKRSAMGLLTRTIWKQL